MSRLTWLVAGLLFLGAAVSGLCCVASRTMNSPEMWDDIKDPGRGDAERRGRDPSDIEDMLQAQSYAWNRGDLDGFMAGYWDSPDLEFVSDTTTHGFQPVKDRYFQRYKAEGKEMGTLTFTDIHVSPMKSDEARATGRWKVVKSKETSSGGFTVELRKFGDGWKIVRDTTTSDEVAKKE